MNNAERNLIFSKILEKIDIPDSAYFAAEKRYEDIGTWLQRKESLCAKYNTHIFPQGSFRLGTVIRPLVGKDEYDLDLSCKLSGNISKRNHTQEQLKNTIGEEIESYRQFRGIKKAKKEKPRCWRLEYKDELKFHMDIVPCIPEESTVYKNIIEQMIKLGSAANLADSVSKHTTAITDNRHTKYKSICSDWHISNPEGYALWFESRMKQAEVLLEDRITFEKIASIDELPAFRWQTPLQQCVKIFKRHRDVMFEDDPDGKPISIIITTLAACFYQGEITVNETMNNIIIQMKDLIDSKPSKILNPVNPAENFADKWAKDIKLRDNFYSWVTQLDSDYRLLANALAADFIVKQAMEKFASSLNIQEVYKIIGEDGDFPAIIKSKEHKITDPASPWCF